MAAGNSNYIQGSMPVEAQKGTFGGFMSMTVYGGSLIAFMLIYPILVFCTPLAWSASLVATLVIGIILGVALKLKGGWFAGIVTLSVFLAIFSALIAFFFG
ncbi:MAG: hypothetical protein ACPGVT_01885 [Maricaulaceae bacterium]